jgi:hypothetical protein
MEASTASIGASLIGATIALVGLVVSKESKISEFRQQWIDSLRNDVASYISLMFFLQAGPPPDEDRKSTKDANELQARIHLRFKFNDPECIDLMNALESLLKASRPTTKRDAFGSLVDRAVDETQKVLGAEWLKVKKGERIYRSITFFMIIFIIAGIYFLWRSSART